MQSIESYQPEYVTRFIGLEEDCQCLFCTTADKTDAMITFNWKNEERKSLFLGCEKACREILLNPGAFILNVTNKQSDSDTKLGEWEQELNQLIINFVINKQLSLEQGLYAISIFLLKAKEYSSTLDHEKALEKIKLFAAELIYFTENGVIQQQFSELPKIDTIKSATLASLGKIPLYLSIPIAQKITFMLKLSELAIMPAAHLDDRREKLTCIWQEQTAPFFIQHDYILCNYILYQLYHHVFPCHNKLNYEELFRLLATDLFNIKNLCAIWQMSNNILNEDNIVKLISAYSRWRMSDDIDYNNLLNVKGLERNDILIGITLLS